MMRKIIWFFSKNQFIIINVHLEIIQSYGIIRKQTPHESGSIHRRIGRQSVNIGH